MNIGAPKAAVVCKYIAEVKPSTVVELGGYVGYSAIVFGDAVKRAGGKQFISLEADPLFAAVARSLVDLAGLGDVVKVMVGKSNDILPSLKLSGEIDSLDMLFMDHWKLLYRQDLKLCEELELVRQGTLLAADNYTATGNPLFSEYLHSSVEEKRRIVKEGPPAGESEKIRKTFGPGGEDLNLDLKGNPELQYEILEIVDVIEPDGRPVSLICLWHLWFSLIMHRTVLQLLGLLKSMLVKLVIQPHLPPFYCDRKDVSINTSIVPSL